MLVYQRVLTADLVFFKETTDPGLSVPALQPAPGRVRSIGSWSIGSVVGIDLERMETTRAEWTESPGNLGNHWNLCRIPGILNCLVVN